MISILFLLSRYWFVIVKVKNMHIYSTYILWYLHKTNPKVLNLQTFCNKCFLHLWMTMSTISRMGPMRNTSHIYNEHCAWDWQPHEPKWEQPPTIKASYLFRLNMWAFCKLLAWEGIHVHEPGLDWRSMTAVLELWGPLPWNHPVMINIRLSLVVWMMAQPPKK